MIKVVFVDTLYWIATARPHDQWSEPSKRARSSLGKARLVTTDEVLAEFLNSFSKSDDCLRETAVKMVKAILSDPNVKVIPQSRDSFLRGVELYFQRHDKAYSLTDCISMNSMKSESLTEVLTNDHHFTEEGFNVLIIP